MDVLEKAYEMLIEQPLCDHCLGRQFALLGYSMENNIRGKALKVSLTMQANDICNEKRIDGAKRLKVLATNGFSKEAQETLRHLKKSLPKKDSEQKCILCEGTFELVNALVEKALGFAADYEYTTFLVGIELPLKVEEREDEFKAAFNVSYGESMRHEFGRLLGKAIALKSNKEADYLKPEIVFVFDPFQEKVRLEINPLYVAGRYRKLVRDIPQSKWYCSRCHGKGCDICGGTGKLYPESVEEYTSKPLLEVTGGEDSFFHASGREDIDARMLGSGRPFVVEISRPKKRFVDLKAIEVEVNSRAVGKVEVFDLTFATKDVVRRLKKEENAQKEYALLAEFEKELSDSDLHLIKEKFSGITVKQQTPQRVMHRRADLIRERYIYKVKVKKVSLKRALLEIRCQGGLYVKELVSGDEGRTNPNVSDLLNNRAKTLRLDVLNVIMEQEDR
jgi:tRNA pseudouridine synthase 10